MKFSTLLITAILSAGALSAPTEPFDSEGPTSDLDARSWLASKPYIGNYAKAGCKGNGIKNGNRPKLDGKKCKTFIHNMDTNGTFPYLKIDFGNLFNTVHTVQLYSDTKCQVKLGAPKLMPDDPNKESICFHADAEGYGDIWSVKAW